MASLPAPPPPERTCCLLSGAQGILGDALRGCHGRRGRRWRLAAQRTGERARARGEKRGCAYTSEQQSACRETKSGRGARRGGNNGQKHELTLSRQMAGLRPTASANCRTFPTSIDEWAAASAQRAAPIFFRNEFRPAQARFHRIPFHRAKWRHRPDSGDQLTRTTPPGSDTTRAPNAAFSWVITTSSRSSLNCAVKRLCPSASFTRMMRPGR